MGQWLYHWVYIDAWCPIWPNLAASLIVYVFVFLKVRSMQEIQKEQVKVHQELKALHQENVAKLDEIKRKLKASD